MAIRIPLKVGEEKTAANLYNKSLIAQDYEIPKTGTIETYVKFRGKYVSSFVLPLTEDGKVVAIRQYRMGIDKIVLELPAGNIKPKESFVAAALRELLEETGYQGGEIISLSHNLPINHDPASTDFLFYPCLCLNCKNTGKMNLDKKEDIEVVLMSLNDWLSATYEIKTNNSYSIITTLLALPHLKKLGIFTQLQTQEDLWI